MEQGPKGGFTPSSGPSSIPIEWFDLMIGPREADPFWTEYVRMGHSQMKLEQGVTWLEHVLIRSDGGPGLFRRKDPRPLVDPGQIDAPDSSVASSKLTGRPATRPTGGGWLD